MPGPSPKSVLPECRDISEEQQGGDTHSQVQETAVVGISKGRESERWVELAWGLWAGWNCPTWREGGRKEVQATAPWQEMNFRNLRYFLIFFFSSLQDLAVWLGHLFSQSHKVRPPVSVEHVIGIFLKFCLESAKLPRVGSVQEPPAIWRLCPHLAKTVFRPSSDLVQGQLKVRLILCLVLLQHGDSLL